MRPHIGPHLSFQSAPRSISIAYTEEWFARMMRGWEAAINEYLQTGRMSAAAQ